MRSVSSLLHGVTRHLPIWVSNMACWKIDHGMFDDFCYFSQRLPFTSRIFHGMFNPFLPFLHPTKKDLDIPWHMSSLVNWNLVDELGCTIIWDNATWPQMIDGMLYYRVSNLPHDNTLQILNVKHSQSTQRQSWHRKFRNQQISDWTSACWTVWNRKSFHGFPFKANSNHCHHVYFFVLQRHRCHSLIESGWQNRNRMKISSHQRIVYSSKVFQLRPAAKRTKHRCHGQSMTMKKRLVGIPLVYSSYDRRHLRRVWLKHRVATDPWIPWGR